MDPEAHARLSRLVKDSNHCLTHQQLQELRQVFNVIDRDNSGALSVDEVHQFMQRKKNADNSINIAKNDAHAMVESVDLDNNGSITFSEFAEAFSHVKNPTTQNVQKAWASKAKINIDFSGNEFSVILASESQRLDEEAIDFFIAGGLGALISRTVTAPFDRVRLLKQTRGTAVGSAKQIVRGILNAQGVKGLWTGNGANCLKAIPQSALVCLLYGVFVSSCSGYRGTDPDGTERLICGACAGLCATTVTYPLDVIRARLSVQTRARHVMSAHLQAQAGKSRSSLKQRLAMRSIYSSQPSSSYPPSTGSVQAPRDLLNVVDSPSKLPVARVVHGSHRSDHVATHSASSVRSRHRKPLCAPASEDVMSTIHRVRQDARRSVKSDVNQYSQFPHSAYNNNSTPGMHTRTWTRYSQRVSASSAAEQSSRAASRYLNNPMAALSSQTARSTSGAISMLGKLPMRALGCEPSDVLGHRCAGLIGVQPHTVHFTASGGNVYKSRFWSSRLFRWAKSTGAKQFGALRKSTIGYAYFKRGQSECGNNRLPLFSMNHGTNLLSLFRKRSQHSIKCLKETYSKLRPNNQHQYDEISNGLNNDRLNSDSKLSQKPHRIVTTSSTKRLSGPREQFPTILSLRMSAPTRPYDGIIDAARTIVHQEGVSGLFRGIKPTLVGVSVFIAMQQAGFDIVVDAWQEYTATDTQNATMTLLSSAAAGTAAQTLIHPIDTIRRRIQVARTTSPRRLSFWQLARACVARDGWRGLYAGLGATYGKVVPAVMISLTVREVVLGRMHLPVLQSIGS